MNRRRVSAALILLALCILAFGASSVVAGTSGPNRIASASSSSYEYGPSILWQNDGIGFRMWWCGATSGVVGDVIWYAHSPDGTTWSDRQVVLKASVNSEETWFTQTGHTCDPSVIRYGSLYYLYYTATSSRDGSHANKDNRIFAALSSDGIHWNKFKGWGPTGVITDNAHPTPILNPVAGANGSYGVGQSSVYYRPDPTSVTGVRFYQYYTDTTYASGAPELLATSQNGIDGWANTQLAFASNDWVVAPGPGDSGTAWPNYRFIAVNAFGQCTNGSVQYMLSNNGVTWVAGGTFTFASNLTAHNIGIVTGIDGHTLPQYSPSPTTGAYVQTYYGGGSVPGSCPFGDPSTWDIWRFDFSS